ncbi:hypothetical protein Aoki45_27280 [Algoriphagus sp. oki45]|nr:hypothetical protein Aoki45_27280 [Algoriphagus sp. oki45]
MKNYLKFLGVMSLVFLLTTLSSMQAANAQGQPNGDYLCKWDAELQWCLMSAKDGYCAYGGDGCQSTIPEVLD